MVLPEGKPPRPFGVTLGILVSILIYTIAPLVVVAAVLVVEQHFENATDGANPFGDEVASGGDFRGGITDSELIMQSGSAILFLVVAVLTWLGGGRWYMRYIFMITVLGFAIFALITTTLPSNEVSEGIGSGGSLDSVNSVISLVGVIARALIVPLYVVWYLNRGPARAFFRGYYLDDRDLGVYAGEQTEQQTTSA